MSWAWCFSAAAMYRESYIVISYSFDIVAALSSSSVDSRIVLVECLIIFMRRLLNSMYLSVGILLYFSVCFHSVFRDSRIAKSIVINSLGLWVLRNSAAFSWNSSLTIMLAYIFASTIYVVKMS